MTDIVATTLGCYPLPNWAKSELTSQKPHQGDDLDNGVQTDDVLTVYDRVRREHVAVQSDTGLDLIVEGQARWEGSLAHPLVVHDHVETRWVVRDRERDTGFHDLVVTGDLSFSGDLAADLDAAADLTADLQAVIPGPYTLATLTTNEHYDDERAFLDATASFLAGELEAFPSVDAVFVLEPTLVTTPPNDDLVDPASHAIDTVAAATDAAVVAQTIDGALEPKVYAHLMDADVDAIGFDFVNDHAGNLELISELGTKRDLSLGLVDGRDPIVETPETITDRIDWVLDNTPPVIDFDTAYVTPNTGLFHVPYANGLEKLRALGNAVAAIERSA